jgi:hypothetical protein
VVLFFLVALLVGLTPAAYSSPPDPTWIDGYWDDGDFDSAVISIVSACAIEVSPVPEGAPRWAYIAAVILPEPAFILASPRPAASSRAPPIARFPRTKLD